MIQFYTISELFNKADINDSFIESFYKLTLSAQNLVVSKNLNLKKWLEEHPDYIVTPKEVTTYEPIIPETFCEKNGLDKQLDEKIEENLNTEKFDKAYSSLNFNQEIIRIENLYLILLNNKNKGCPIHKKKLAKKKVLVKADNSYKKTVLNVCVQCKRFYSMSDRDIHNLNKLGIPYKTVDINNEELV